MIVLTSTYILPTASSVHRQEVTLQRHPLAHVKCWLAPVWAGLAAERVPQTALHTDQLSDHMCKDTTAVFVWMQLLWCDKRLSHACHVMQFCGLCNCTLHARSMCCHHIHVRPTRRRTEPQAEEKFCSLSRVIFSPLASLAALPQVQLAHAFRVGLQAAAAPHSWSACWDQCRS